MKIPMSETMKRAEKAFSEDGDSGVEMFIKTLSEQEKQELLIEAKTGLISMILLSTFLDMLFAGDDK